jgi:hypothetical protein
MALVTAACAAVSAVLSASCWTKARVQGVMA